MKKISQLIKQSLQIADHLINKDQEYQNLLINDANSGNCELIVLNT